MFVLGLLPLKKVGVKNIYIHIKRYIIRPLVVFCLFRFFFTRDVFTLNLRILNEQYQRLTSTDIVLHEHT